MQKRIVSLIIATAFVIAPEAVLAAPEPLPAPHPLHEHYNAGLGRTDAIGMIRNGQLTIIGAGLPPVCSYVLRQKLYKQNGIHWTVVGDNVSDGFDDYRDAFNQAMIEHISKKRGDDFLGLLDMKIAHQARLKCPGRDGSAKRG